MTTSSTASSTSSTSTSPPFHGNEISHQDKIIIAVVVCVFAFVVLPAFLYVIHNHVLGRNRATTPPTNPNPAVELKLEGYHKQTSIPDPYVSSKSPPPQKTLHPHTLGPLGMTGDDPYRQKRRVSPIFLRDQASSYSVHQYPDPYLTSKSPPPKERSRQHISDSLGVKEDDPYHRSEGVGRARMGDRAGWV